MNLSIEGKEKPVSKREARIKVPKPNMSAPSQEEQKSLPMSQKKEIYVAETRMLSPTATDAIPINDISKSHPKRFELTYETARLDDGEVKAEQKANQIDSETANFETEQSAKMTSPLRIRE